MIKLAVATITYNDVYGLDRLIKSIDKQVDHHFIIDGKFPNMPGESEYSNDGTKDVILQYQNHEGHSEIFYEQLSASEFEMRQRYLQFCEMFHVDALLILDSDEYIDNKITHWTIFRSQIEQELIKQAPIKNKQNVYSVEGFWGAVWDVPRLWLWPSQMTYIKDSHKIYKNKYHDMNLNRDGRMYAVSKRIKWFAFRFIQDSSFRSRERRRQKDQYQDWLNVYEGSLV